MFSWYLMQEVTPLSEWKTSRKAEDKAKTVTRKQQSLSLAVSKCKNRLHGYFSRKDIAHALKCSDTKARRIAEHITKEDIAEMIASTFEGYLYRWKS